MPISAEKERVTRRNRTWYTQGLGDLVRAKFARIDIDPPAAGWSLFNPCVTSYRGEMICNVRSSNYTIVGGRYEMPEADDGCIKTRNTIVRVSDDLAVSGPVEVIAEYDRTDFKVDGLEDVRLDERGGKLVCSATVRNWSPHDGTCRQAVGEIDMESGRVENLRCHATVGESHEKNWMPISGTDRWLYHCHANGSVCTVREDEDDWTVEVHAKSPRISAGFRGGSQVVEVGDGVCMAVVHEVAEDDGRRIYEHRFVEFSTEDWRIVSISQPFWFREHRQIEFCAGLTRRGLSLVLSFGVRDAEAWLVEVSLPDVWRLMRPV